MDTKSFYFLAGFVAALLGALFYLYYDTIQDRSPPEFHAALEKWRSHNIANYDMRIQVLCFCDPRPLLVEVRDGQAVDVRLENPNEDNGFGPIDPTRRKLTIDDVFSSIARAYSFRADHIEVRYDPTYGYPVEADVDESTDTFDDEWHMTVALREVQDGA